MFVGKYMGEKSPAGKVGSPGKVGRQESRNNESSSIGRAESMG